MSDCPLPPLPARFRAPTRLRLAFGALLAVLTLLLLWKSVFISIGAGQAGVRWSRFGGGTVMERPYGEGISMIWPWDEMTVYDVRLQQMHDTIHVLTRDGLRVAMGVTVRFAPRVAELATLHRMVGPHYRRILVWPDVIAAVRHIVRQSKADDLRVLGEDGLAARVDAAARDAVRDHWIALDRVLITAIALPERVEAQIEARLAEEQKALTGPSILRQAETERDRLSLEADGVRAFEARARVSMLQWRRIEALERLAASPNSKTVVLGGDHGESAVLLEPDGGAALVSGLGGVRARPVGAVRLEGTRAGSAHTESAHSESIRPARIWPERIQPEGVKEKAEAQDQH